MGRPKASVFPDPCTTALCCEERQWVEVRTEVVWGVWAHRLCCANDVCIAHDGCWKALVLDVGGSCEVLLCEGGDDEVVEAVVVPC